MVKTLYETPWIELKQIDEDEYSYVFSHEKRCKGMIVSVLPFRYANDRIEFMLRSELTPCWDQQNNIVSTITGGVENGDPMETAKHEIEEESGYEIRENDLIYLGSCYISKSADTVAHLFSVDLTGKERKKAKGDGSYLETRAHSFWTTNISESLDPLAYISYIRVQGQFK